MHVVTVHDPFHPLRGREVRQLRNRRRISKLVPKTDRPFVVLVDGQPVLRQDWERSVGGDQVVVIFMLPQGGGGSSPLRVIGMLAVIAASFVVGPMIGAALGTAFGVGAAAASAIGSSLVMFGGSMLLNAIVPPPAANTGAMSGANTPAASPTYSLQAQGNAARLGQPIPVQYGRLRVYPDFAALPYVEYASNEQYLYQLLCIGQGEYDVEAIQINETPIANFKEVTYELLPNGIKPSLFPANVSQSSEVAGQEIMNATPIGPFVANAAGTVCKSIGIDLLAPRGMYYANDGGGLDSRSASIKVEARLIDQMGNPIGSWTTIGPDESAYTAWTDWTFYAFIGPPPLGLSEVPPDTATEKYQLRAAGGLIYRSTRSFLGNSIITLTGATTTPIRKTYRFDVSGLGAGQTYPRFQVRCSRLDTKDTSTRAGNEIDWSGMRAYMPDTNSYGDVTMLAVRAQATNNLSAMSARQINVVATRKLKTVTATGLSAATSATRSVAAALADIATNTVYGGGIAAANIDWAALYSLEQALAARGDFLDVRFDSATTLWEALTQAGVVARTKPFMQGGVLHFVRDQAQTVPVALFSMRNIVQNSMSINYLTPTNETSDSVQVTYFDKTTWQQTTVSCVLSGSAGANPAKISLLGITERAQAFREGLYQSAANKYRRKVIKFSTEAEGFIPAFGDLIAIQHDIPAWGQVAEVAGYAIGNNLALQSEALNTSPWSGSASATIAPEKFGPASFWTIAKTVSTTSESREQSLGGVLSGDVRTLTIALLAGSTDKVSVGLYNSANAWGLVSDRTAEVISGPGTLSTRSGALMDVTGLSAVEPTVIRISRAQTVAGTALVYIYPGTPISTTIGHSIKATAVQVEAGWNYSPYVKTTTAVRTGVSVLTANEDFTWTAGATHYVGLRKRDGSVNGPYVAAQGARANILVLASTPSSLPYIGADEERTHIAFGPGDAWRQPARVVSVQPRGPYQVEITAINEDPSVHTAESGRTAPALSFSQLPITAPLPAVSGLTLRIDVTGATPQYVASWNASPGADHYVAEISWDGGATWTPLATEFGTSHRWAANRNASASVRVAAVNIGRGSWATASVSYSAQPDTPSGFSAAFNPNQLQLQLSWAPSPELDVVGYEVRTTDSGWGTAGAVFSGFATGASTNAPAAGASQTYYLRAVDFLGNYSAASATVTFAAPSLTNISAFTASFFDTSATSATVTLTWANVVPPFGLRGYQISYGSTVLTTSSNTITLQADWLGDRAITVKTIDLLGNMSSGYTQTVNKQLPASPTGLRVQVIDNNVMLYWSQPAVTTLPISHYLLRRGGSWDAADVDYGRKDGQFTTVLETAGGTYTYWVATVDTDGYVSTPVSISAVVAQPPDFVLYGGFNSAFSGTKSSALLENGALILPVNTSETWAAHFTARGWTSPQDQINAGYPVFIQPSVASGYYEEVFDFGTVLASSRVSLAYLATTIAGSPVLVKSMSTSVNGSTWLDYPGQDQVFATNFRYVKVRISATDTAGTGIVSLTSLSVTLDAKLKNDAGFAFCSANDTSGTVANFSSTFVDVASITLTPQGTTPVTAVYDFLDAVINGTYSVAGNVCTVNATAHNLVVGQNVRLSFTSGTAPAGVYTVTSVVNANAYTVALTTANTSGSVSTYPQGMRIYLFNNSGARVSGTASWSIRGT